MYLHYDGFDVLFYFFFFFCLCTRAATASHQLSHLGADDLDESALSSLSSDEEDDTQRRSSYMRGSSPSASMGSHRELPSQQQQQQHQQQHQHHHHKQQQQQQGRLLRVSSHGGLLFSSERVTLSPRVSPPPHDGAGERGRTLGTPRVGSSDVEVHGLTRPQSENNIALVESSPHRENRHHGLGATCSFLPLSATDQGRGRKTDPISDSPVLAEKGDGF